MRKSTIPNFVERRVPSVLALTACAVKRENITADAVQTGWPADIISGLRAVFHRAEGLRIARTLPRCGAGLLGLLCDEQTAEQRVEDLRAEVHDEWWHEYEAPFGAPPGEPCAPVPT